MPTVMARFVTRAGIAENEDKATFQENRLLKVISANPKGSIADWATACGWVLKGKEGQPDRPYKSLVSRVMTRLEDDQSKVGGRASSPTTAGFLFGAAARTGAPS
jgi:hypothetical protein